MEKKLQVSKNVNKDVKNHYFAKPRKVNIVSERPIDSRQSIKSVQSGFWSRPQPNEGRRNAKPGVCLPLSLSNEDFIMANAQILIKQDLSIFEDVYDQWDDIVQVNFYTHEELRCPICLCPPSVPRTDKCGHAYCLSCLLKYLSLKSDFHNKCALCGQNIDIKRIKRAGVISVFHIKTSDILSMLLMKRDKIGSPPLPINILSSQLPHCNSAESRFSNVAVCPNDDLLSIIQLEMMTLQDELSAAMLEEGNDRLLSISEAFVSVKNEFEGTSHFVSTIPTKTSKCEINTIDDLKKITATNSVFYQSEDGSNIFMSPVNWKCMQYEFVEQNQCLPIRISAPIVDIEKYIVTAEFQNRYRYLQFLPMGSSVTFVELDLKEILSAATLENFSVVLQQRSDSRIHKQKLDEVLTSEKMKHEDSFNTSSRFIHLTSLMKPICAESFTEDDFLPLNNYSKEETSSDNNHERKSFADMLQKHSLPQVNNVFVTEVDNDDSQFRGISLKDCLVVKKTKKKLK